MDKLTDLPEVNTNIQHEEKQIINDFFEQDPENKLTSVNDLEQDLSWRRIGYITALFISLNNPLTDGILGCLHPLCQSSIFLTLIKAIIFVIGYYAIVKYV